MSTRNCFPASASDAQTEHNQDGPGAEYQPTSRRQVQSPSDYAQAVYSYSQLSSAPLRYAGSHFENLARYLQQPYQARAPHSISEHALPRDGQSFDFVTIYDLDPSASEHAQHINSIPEFETKADKLRDSTSGHLVFLKGYPSPEWILSIGAKYQVDPEYFRRHLDFRQGLRDSYSLPPLPSTSSSGLKLRLTTIGNSVTKLKTNIKQDMLEALRVDNKANMEAYREKLGGFAEMNLGDSIVRDCSVHDLQHSTIEQDISIFVTTYHKAWVALIWLDTVNNLKEAHTSCLASPLRTASWTLSTLPINHPSPGIALGPTSQFLTSNSTDEFPSTGMVQSADLLHLDYGRKLDRHLAAKDTFYALHELLYFAACSENQFLNMLDTKLNVELDPEIQNPTVSDLLYNEQVLDRHIQQIRETLRSIQSHTSLSWPRGDIDPDKQCQAVAVRQNLIQDYEQLLSRSLVLGEKCSIGIRVAMSNATIKASRDAMAQVEEMAQLTRLAFVVIPLSFTASFFGMNFSQFGQGYQSMWMWFAVSFPIFAVCLFFMQYDAVEKFKRLFSWLVPRP